MTLIVRDSNGTQLADGDSVTLIKDLKVKGTSVTLKRGTMVKGIRLTDNEDEIECKVEKVKGLVLRTSFRQKSLIARLQRSRHAPMTEYVAAPQALSGPLSLSCAADGHP